MFCGGKDLTMIEFCTVTFINRSERKTSQVACIQDSLFALLWIFDHSNEVIAFKVSRGKGLVSFIDFGWGKFDKWVSSFAQEHYDENFEGRKD